jgi:hypothetical protein
MESRVSLGMQVFWVWGVGFRWWKHGRGFQSGSSSGIYDSHLDAAVRTRAVGRAKIDLCPP